MREDLPCVLIVDDVEANLVALDALLSNLGCELVRARSGNDGLKELLKREFAVMMLDVQMPGMDGFEMARIARSNSATREIPVIFLTAMNQTEDNLLQGYGSGAVDILFKPVSAVILRSKVRVFLDLYAARRKLADESEARRKASVELAQSRDALEERNRALVEAQRQHRELTEFIVHDLKNPLSAVCGGLDILHGEMLDDGSDLRSVVSDAREAAARVQTMIEDLLMIARMEQADLPLRRESLSVTKLLRQVIQGFVRRAQERGIVLSSPPDVLLEVEADGTLLRRVFENILDNAFRYTPERGRIAVSVRKNAAVEISVSNDGPAIPVNDRPHIFEKFRRGGDDRFTPGNAGLGLYFCKRAVEAHGGDITVDETADWPTSFRISLPSGGGPGRGPSSRS